MTIFRVFYSTFELIFMKNRIFYALFLLIFHQIIYAQVVTTNPVFPIDDQQVTITFDAAEGNKELKDCNCVVYAHTGLITDKSTSGSDWKYVQGVWGTDDVPRKMTSLGNNKYSISYNIKTFYGASASDKVLKLAFVFRNVNGSKVGRSSTGSDIFVDVYGANAGLQTLLIQPTSNNIIATTGQSIPVKFVASKLSTLQLFINNTIATEKLNTAQLDYNFVVGSSGDYFVEAKSTVGSELSVKSFNVVVPKTNIIEAIPANSLLGANRINNGIRLVLEAPNKNNAFLIGNFNNWRPSVNYQMKKTPDGKYFWIDYISSNTTETLMYQYVVDGITIADPLSELILDPQNDKYIDPTVFPNMPAYPNAPNNGHVSVILIGAPAYPWANTTFSPVAKEDLVVYELLVRDFVKKHDFKTIQDTLNYLQRLGVNAIELMPINEFENNQSWGYNPSYHMALDKYYGSPERFKALVDEAHKRGIAIILDVVFNHAFGQSPLCSLYWDAANNKPSTFNPWLNPDAKHPYNVGYDFNHESSSTKDYVKRCLNYWLTEYKVDGFRFDLSKGFTQNPSNESNFSNYDASRIAILKGYGDAIWATKPNAFVILEHFAENKEEIELANYGFMLWGNMNYNYNEATMGYTSTSNFSGIYYGNRGWSKPNLMGYMESHDEERLMFKNLQYGNSSGSYNIKTLPTALDRNGLAAAFFYTIPGPKMMWQFGEVGYDYSINTCEDLTINNGCRLSNKPIRWDYINDANRRKLYNITADLAYLKQTQPVFKSLGVSTQLTEKTKWITISSPSMNVVTIGNFDVSKSNISVTFPSKGWYFDYLKGDSINITNQAQTISLEAGEYHVYLSQKLKRPSINFPTDIDELALNDQLQLKIIPNPSSLGSLAKLHIDYTEKLDYLNIRIYNLNGQLIEQIKNNNLNAENYQIDMPQLQKGFYVVECQTNLGKKATKWVVLE